MTEVINEQQNNNNNNQQNQGDNNSKVQKNYEVTMRKIVAIVGGESNLVPSKKVSGDVMEDIVQELLREDKEALQIEVKTELKSLLTKNIEKNKAIAKSEADLAKLKIEKMKEFNEAASKLFAKIDNMGTIEKEYYDSLNQAANPYQGEEIK